MDISFKIKNLNSIIYSQLKNENNAENIKIATKARLHIKPIQADKSAKQPNVKPNGINT